MALEELLSTQTAILLAGALIGAGLYFGLRGSESASARGDPIRSAAAETTGEAGAARRPQPQQVPPAITPDRAATTVSAMKEIERSRAAVVEKCIRPALAKFPGLSKLKFHFNITFDAEGHQIARGLVDDRETARFGVGPCVSDAVPTLLVPPPGGSVFLELDWTLP